MAIEKSMINLIALNEKRRKLAEGNAELAKAMIAGEKAFNGLCSTCHGADGKGGGTAAAPIAPSFHHNPRISGNTAALINTVITGMIGPIDGINYAGGMMPSIASNGDQYVADVLTYIRNEFGNQGSIVSKEDVEKVRISSQAREKMWTQDELTQAFSNKLNEKSKWKLTTNFKMDPERGVDKMINDHYSWPKARGAEARKKGHAITLELHKPAFVSQVIINSEAMLSHYARNVEVDFSIDGKRWVNITKNPAARDVEVNETLGLKTKFIRITNQIDSAGENWGISELDLIGSYVD
jgi:mono/diheme cytochrome c family protein